jgi:hypothetical protein
MGLDTTHDAWHGPYGSFSRWRQSVAQAAGITSYQVPDSSGYMNTEYDHPEWDDRLSLDEVQGKWKRKLDEPLFYLIWHSDCDGYIKPKQAKLLAARLKELLPKMSESDSWDWKYTTRGRTEAFIAGLERAIAEDKKVKFH